MVKIADYIFLFILNAVGMILELVASRLMSPYFGNSTFVWTAIISIILLANILGNLIGGKIASKKNAHSIVCLTLLFAAIYIAITPIIHEPIFSSIKQSDMEIRLATILASTLFFLIPSVALGVATPVIMKEYIADKKDNGKESGRITAIVAFGSLVGTILGGFFLIPAFGTNTIFSIIAIVIILLTLLYRPINSESTELSKLIFFAVLVAATIITIYSIVAKNISNNDLSVSVDTEYGRIIIEDGEYFGRKVRFYKQSGGFESATFLDEKKKYDLVFDYTKKYDEMFNFKEVKSVAMIGGAAYQYPKYFVSHFEDKKIDVIEIDPVATELAKKYFFLDDLLKDYGEDRIGLYTDDGRVFLEKSDKKYDAILNDAFSGEVPVGTLATVEAARIIRSHLADDGVYLSNVIGAVSGDDGKFLRAEVKTLKKVFKNVYVISAAKAQTDIYRNMMVIATDSDSYKPSNTLELEITNEDIILTDDYNPVDSLIPVGK